MEAILRVNKGEKPYQVIRSGWLRDSDGDVLFKMLSKMRADGQIESAYVVERRSGRKTVIARTTTDEKKYPKAIAAFRQMIWDKHPNADLKVEDIDPIDTDNPNSTSQYTALKANKRNVFWLLIKRRLRLR